MDRLVYIYDFNSGRNSRSGHKLSPRLGVPVICQEYNYSKSFAECLTNIRQQVSKAIDKRNDRVIVGRLL